MFKQVAASQLVRKMANGRTSPCLIVCEDGLEDVELVVKFSAGCFEKEKNLVIEAIAAMLGADLGLPVPEPFLVDVDSAFVESVADSELKDLIQRSNRLAFGSKKLPDGFAVWPTNGRIPASLSQAAAEVFVFDAIIANSDRRPVNPNCLYTGNEIGIFDHELSFASQQILFWKAPWLEGGFDTISEPDKHIFAPANFEAKPKDLHRFESAWSSLPNSRFQEYCEAIPFEWGDHDAYLKQTVEYLNEVRSNIPEIVRRGLERLS